MEATLWFHIELPGSLGAREDSPPLGEVTGECTPPSPTALSEFFTDDYVA
jgi:hypothetical protein